MKTSELFKKSISKTIETINNSLLNGFTNYADSGIIDNFRICKAKGLIVFTKI